MSGAVTLSTVATIASIASSAYTLFSGAKADKAQREAQNQARAAADAQASAAQQEFNRANQKRPDVSSILSAAEQASRGGESSTMLTGPQGIAQNMLSLGKNTLLGQ
jgi:hypothetical protein